MLVAGQRHAKMLAKPTRHIRLVLKIKNAAKLVERRFLGQTGFNELRLCVIDIGDWRGMKKSVVVVGYA